MPAEEEQPHETLGGMLAAFLRRAAIGNPEPESPPGRILSAARRLFAAGGFEGTATRAIAAEARVNQAMIHYYYRSKMRLYQGVIATEFVAIMRSIASGVAADRPVEEIVVELPTGLLRELERDPVRRDLLRREIGGGAVHLRSALSEMRLAGPRGLSELIRPVIDRAQAANRLPRVMPDALLQFILSVAYGTLFMDPIFALVTGRDTEDEEFRQERRRAFRTLLHRLLLAEEVQR